MKLTLPLKNEANPIRWPCVSEGIYPHAHPIEGFHTRHAGGRNKRKFTHIVCIKKSLYGFSISLELFLIHFSSFLKLWGDPKFKMADPGRPSAVASLRLITDVKENVIRDTIHP